MINEPHYINLIHKVLDHGISHLKKSRERGTSFDMQLAMISIDNSVELTLKAYLGIRHNILFPSLVDKLKENLPDGFFERFPSFLSLNLLIPEWDLLFNPKKNDEVDTINLIKNFHKIRNNLYHDVIKEDVRRKIVLTYASLAWYLLHKIFNKTKGDITINIRDHSKLIDQFLKLWKKIEDKIMRFFLDVMDINYDYNLPFALDVLLHEYIIDIKTFIILINISIHNNELKEEFQLSREKVRQNLNFLIEFEPELEENIKLYYDNEENI